MSHNKNNVTFVGSSVSAILQAWVKTKTSLDPDFNL